MASRVVVNQLWDQEAGEVVAAQNQRPGARVIQAEAFDASRYRTVLQLKGPAALWRLSHDGHEIQS